MSVRRASNRQQAGFTLVELLVALTLLGLVFVMLFGGLRFGTRSWEAVVNENRERERIMATQAFLRARLSEYAHPRPSRQARPTAASGIHGRPDRLDFRAPWLSALSVGGLYEFSLEMDDSADARRLILAWRPADPSAAVENLGEVAGQRVLLDGIERLDISYFGAVENEGEPVWVGEWPEQALAPALVRIEVDFIDPGREWPPLVVHPVR